MNSREKGKRGERQWRDELRANGYCARRGQQFAGSAESPDVVCDELPWIHFEVKAVERLNVQDAMDQARHDCGMRSAECGVRSAENTDCGASEEVLFVAGDDGGGDVLQVPVRRVS